MAQTSLSMFFKKVAPKVAASSKATASGLSSPPAGGAEVVGRKRGSPVAIAPPAEKRARQEEATAAADDAAAERLQLFSYAAGRAPPPPPPHAAVQQRRQRRKESEGALGRGKGRPRQQQQRLVAPKASPGKARGGGREGGGGGRTPLEKTIVRLWQAHPGVLLAVECGYRYIFYGTDAEQAARVLRIYLAQPKGSASFKSCSVPTHRIFVHVHRLVTHGLKVGLVQQTETRALKAAGENRNKLFSRELTQVFTKATFVSPEVHAVTDEEERPSGSARGAEEGGYLLCLYERSSTHATPALSQWSAGAPESAASATVDVMMVAVQPSTGDIVWDCFQDNFLRTELELRLQTLAPMEVILPPPSPHQYALSRATERLIRNYCQQEGGQEEAEAEATGDGEVPTPMDVDEGGDGETAAEEDKAVEEDTEEQLESESVRLERCADFDHTRNMARVQQFFAEDDTARAGLEKIPAEVLICVGVLIAHLSQFGLEGIIRLTDSFRSFAEAATLEMNATAVQQLELLESQDLGFLQAGHAVSSKRGSLLAVVDRTRTAFGGRLLRRWLLHPLCNIDAIRRRHSAVEELLTAREGPGILVNRIRGALERLPDLERGVCRLYYNKCAPAEFFAVMKAFLRLCTALPTAAQARTSGLASPLVLDLLDAIPVAELKEAASYFLASMDEAAVKAKNKSSLFLSADGEEFAPLRDLKGKLDQINAELDDVLAGFRRSLGIPRLKYSSVSQVDFLIELPRDRKAPAGWEMVQQTKSVSRYHAPEVKELLQILEEVKEELDIAADSAWSQFVEKFKEQFAHFRCTITSVAQLDCLLGFAELAQQQNYVRPEMAEEEGCLVVQDGRHPIVEQLSSAPFVPNDTLLEGSRRAMVITGPNMGGKSCYIRQVALLLILAQAGSFVPCSSARFSPVDRILVRMGAQDSLEQGKSTFLVEMQETAEILRKATSRSLVIMDELGRGTSTHDGVAIAYGTLKHLLINLRCSTLFVTHHHVLCQMEAELPALVGNYHMSFLDNTAEPGGEHLPRDQVVTFLFKVVQGMATKSYGLNVARLAGVSDDVLTVAAAQSQHMAANMRLVDTSADASSLATVCRLSQQLEADNTAADAWEQLLRVWAALKAVKRT